ncbi:MAG: hypothetical protein ABH950_08255 [Candidatus Altiarchaeota archaeon]
MRKYSIILLVYFFSSITSAATIHGTVYSWETFDPQPDVFVEVNSSPAQALVSEDGSYSFELQPGIYLLEASFFSDNSLESYAAEDITVTGEGEFVRDIIALPYLGEEFLVDPDQLPEIESLVEEEEIVPEEKVSEEKVEKTQSTDWVTPLGFAALICVVAIIFWPRKKGKEEQIIKKEIIEKTSYVSLPEDLAKAMDVIQKEGGRITQKELRRKMNYFSEAKMSLLITDLEDRKLIRKIKKGRGNILIANEP